MQDVQEAEALERALEKWREGMEERAKNPRIALMVRDQGRRSCACVLSRTVPLRVEVACILLAVTRIITHERPTYTLKPK